MESDRAGERERKRELLLLLYIIAGQGVSA